MTGIAIGLGFISGVAFGPLAILVVAGLVAARLIWPDGRTLLVPALVLLLATGLGVWRGAVVTHPLINWPSGTSAVVGKVASDPTGPETGLRFVVNVNGVKRGNAWVAAGGVLCVIAHTRQPVGFGDLVQLQGTPRPAASQSAVDQDYLASRGCGASMLTYTVWIEQTGGGLRRAIGDARRKVDETLMSATDGDNGALLAGLVTGNDWHLSPERRQAFLRTSTSHITAVSGANLALLITVLVALAGGLGARRPLAWDLALGVAITGYAAMTGFGAPIVRAGVVAVLAVLAVRWGRKPDFVTLLMLTAAVMVAVNPLYLWSLSFRLSFVSSLALVLTAQRVRPHGVAGWVGAGLLATAAADLATLPFLPNPSLGLPLVAIPANMLIGPLIEIAYPLACIVALIGMISGPAAQFVAVPADVLCRIVFAIVDRLGVAGEALAASARWPPLGIALAAVLALVLVQFGADGERFRHRLRRMSGTEWRTILGVAAVAMVTLGASAGAVLLLS